ncbi:MAG: hypothetical protein R3A13_09090 [Bdellovibrionota bacterium]
MKIGEKRIGNVKEGTDTVVDVMEDAYFKTRTKHVGFTYRMSMAAPGNTTSGEQSKIEFTPKVTFPAFSWYTHDRGPTPLAAHIPQTLFHPDIYKQVAGLGMFSFSGMVNVSGGFRLEFYKH